jgi:TatD DNase family protein
VNLIDTHCHLDPAYFADGGDAAMARAREAGVSGFVVVGVGSDLSPARHAVKLARSRPSQVAAVVGVHPHDASTLDDATYGELREMAADPVVACVGEIGLDYHYDHSPRQVQRQAFTRLIGLARELAKPIVVHTRSAAEDTLAILEGEGAGEVGGIIHCFSEDQAFAERALALGFYLSFSGIVTFKNAKSVHEVAASAPEDRILVETDSPYLAPIPLRGKPCEPAYVLHTARRLAELRGSDLDHVAEVTSLNAARAFRRGFSV